ncbi:MAG: hypothetical protein CSB46_00880 [Micrococcales bacterium]|nr:MAG: hypothetical protein CSB46_00880 [Micrococcales bacterium]
MHWLIIDTGRKQDYIFETNRLRHMIGASQLIHQVGRSWVDQAVDELTPTGTVEIVQKISGKALLLISDPDEGRRLIRSVTTRAVDEAGGLEVAGVTGPPFDPDREHVPDPANQRRAEPDFVSALEATYSLLDQRRRELPSVLQRDPVLPWHEQCRETGWPTARFELYGQDPRVVRDWHPAAHAVEQRTRHKAAGRARMAQAIGDPGNKIIPEEIDTITHDGWIALIHADGNNVGSIFLRFPELAAQASKQQRLSLAVWREYMENVSAELADATEAAIRDAIADVDPILQPLIAKAQARMPANDKRHAGPVMPIVIGGDDVTVVCHSDLAVPLTAAYLRRFEKQTAAKSSLSEVSKLCTGKPHLCAGAGIVYVKPHHPFYRAYAMTESLATETKRATKKYAPASSGFDIHFAFDATPDELDRERATARHDAGPDQAIRRHAGPYLVTTGDGAAQPGSWQSLHDVHHLNQLIEALRPEGWLSSSQAHFLREGIDLGAAIYRQRLLGTRAGVDASEADLLEPVADSPAHEDAPMVRLLDAMLLNGAGSGGAL